MLMPSYIGIVIHYLIPNHGFLRAPTPPLALRCRAANKVLFDKSLSDLGGPTRQLLHALLYLLHPCSRAEKRISVGFSDRSKKTGSIPLSLASDP
jgi:hypothetical protein